MPSKPACDRREMRPIGRSIRARSNRTFDEAINGPEADAAYAQFIEAVNECGYEPVESDPRLPLIEAERELRLWWATKMASALRRL